MTCHHNKTPCGSKNMLSLRLKKLNKILEPVIKIQMMKRIKVDRNNGICPDFGRNIWMAVETTKMSCHWLIRTCTFFHDVSRACLVWSLSWFTCNLSYAWFKVLVPASSFPNLILSCATFSILSVKFTWDLNTSSAGKTYHSGKSHIIWRKYSCT